MEWCEALEIVVARTGHERFRALCDPSHPEHELNRVQMIRMAGGTPTDSLPADREAILRRRAAKPRLLLGQKPPPPGRR